MAQKAKQALFRLYDGQIAVSRPVAIDDGPRVATQMRGGECLTQSQCEEAGGEWIVVTAAGHTGGVCEGANCVDSGTGDWD